MIWDESPKRRRTFVRSLEYSINTDLYTRPSTWPFPFTDDGRYRTVRITQGHWVSLNRYIQMQQVGVVRSLEQLSSGHRINRASDDAAGLSISSRMQALALSTTASLRNIADGLGFLQTADGAAQEVHRLLQRAREMAVLSATSTVSDADRAHLQAEWEQIQSALDDIPGSARFNGVSIFSGSQGAGAPAEPSYTLTEVDLGAETFNTASGIGHLNQAAVSGGAVQLAAASVQQAAESFASPAGVDTAATGNVRIANGAAALYGAAAYNIKGAGAQAGGAVLTGTTGQWNAYGVATNDVLYDGATGTYKMWFTTGTTASANTAVGYATSTDGVTWSTPQQTTLAGGRGSIRSQQQISVYQDGGTYYLLYRGGTNSVRYRTSTDGLNWSTEKTLLSGINISDRATVVRDAGGLYHLFADSSSGIRQYTATSLTGAWSQVAGFTLAGYRPEVVAESDAQGNATYALYYKQTIANTTIVRATSTDLLNWSAPVQAVSRADTAGISMDNNYIRVGGVVFDPVTGVSRMFTSGRATATGTWGAGLAYVRALTTGTYQSKVFATADTLTTIRLNAQAVTPAGTALTYAVSADGGSTWTTVTPGQDHTLATPGRQLVVRATLTNNDPAGRPESRPVLDGWDLLLQGHAATGELVSTAWSAGGREIESVTVTPDESLGTDTSVRYFGSTDGTTWQALTPGAATTLVQPGNQVFIRALLSTADRSDTPVLNGYSLKVQAREYASEPPATASLPASVRVQVGPEWPDALWLEVPELDASALGLTETALGSREAAVAALDELDLAIRHTTAILTAVGAQAERLEHALGHRTEALLHLQTGTGRIRDVDTARAVLELARGQMVLQTSLEALSLGLGERRGAIAALIGRKG